jgi:multidrug resistance efflux pump
VVNEAIEALAVRAPISGRLTDFHLQLGEIVKAEQMAIFRYNVPAAPVCVIGARVMGL